MAGERLWSSVLEDADWGDLDLTDAFAEVKGTSPKDGMKYFIEMYWLETTTGFTGPVRRTLFMKSSARASQFPPQLQHPSDAFVKSFLSDCSPFDSGKHGFERA